MAIVQFVGKMYPLSQTGGAQLVHRTSDRLTWPPYWLSSLP